MIAHIFCVELWLQLVLADQAPIQLNVQGLSKIYYTQGDCKAASQVKMAAAATFYCTLETTVPINSVS